jgi:hypothetical protein
MSDWFLLIFGVAPFGLRHRDAKGAKPKTIDSQLTIQGLASAKNPADKKSSTKSRG